MQWKRTRVALNWMLLLLTLQMLALALFAHHQLLLLPLLSLPLEQVAFSRIPFPFAVDRWRGGVRMLHGLANAGE